MLRRGVGWRQRSCPASEWPPPPSRVLRPRRSRSPPPGRVQQHASRVRGSCGPRNCCWTRARATSAPTRQVTSGRTFGSPPAPGNGDVPRTSTVRPRAGRRSRSVPKPARRRHRGRMRDPARRVCSSLRLVGGQPCVGRGHGPGSVRVGKQCSKVKGDALKLPSSPPSSNLRLAYWRTGWRKS